MNQRFLMWGLTSIAFAVALTISSWQQGLWPSGDSATRVGRPTAPTASTAFTSTEPTPIPVRPFAPENAASVTATPPVALAAATAKPETQPQDPPPTRTPAEASVPAMPVAEAEVDTTEFLAHRDRAAQHSSRAR